MSARLSHTHVMALALLLPWLLLLHACPETGDDDSGGDDDAADDDDSAGDDDAADDDDSAPQACTVNFGPPGMQVQLTGTCGPSPESCEGGIDLAHPEGTCDAALVCCIDTDQCESALMGVCAESPEQCEGEPPGGGSFPAVGCPAATPVCCVPPAR